MDPTVAYVANTVERVEGFEFHPGASWKYSQAIRDGISARVAELAEAMAARGFVDADWSRNNLLFQIEGTDVSLKRVDFENCFSWGTSEPSKLVLLLRPHLRGVDPLEMMISHSHDICFGDLLAPNQQRQFSYGEYCLSLHRWLRIGSVGPQHGRIAALLSDLDKAAAQQEDDIEI